MKRCLDLVDFAQGEVRFRGEHHNFDFDAKSVIKQLYSIVIWKANIDHVVENTKITSRIFESCFLGFH